MTIFLVGAIYAFYLAKKCVLLGMATGTGMDK